MLWYRMKYFPRQVHRVNASFGENYWSEMRTSFYTSVWKDSTFLGSTLFPYCYYLMLTPIGPMAEFCPPVLPMGKSLSLSCVHVKKQRENWTATLHSRHSRACRFWERVDRVTRGIFLNGQANANTEEGQIWCTSNVSKGVFLNFKPTSLGKNR